jgi:hypothetical protein
MNRINWNNVWIGFILGMIGPFILMLGYYGINYSYMTFGGFMNYLRQGETHAPLLSLCVLANLLPFYLLINRDKYEGTKGVLGATFLWAALVVYFKFFF